MPTRRRSRRSDTACGSVVAFPCHKRTKFITRSKQVGAFLTRIFDRYPAQDVKGAEIRAFTLIRNDIVHRGEMTTETQKQLEKVYRGQGVLVGESYARDLHREYARLKALFERVVLALLDEPSPRLESSWRYWLFSA
jgi:hypothetical protein